MNAFYEHHKNSIEFGYRCFDRLLLNGLIQPFQQPERVLGFFNAYRDGRRKMMSPICDKSAANEIQESDVSRVTTASTP